MLETDFRITHATIQLETDVLTHAECMVDAGREHCGCSRTGALATAEI